MMEPKKREPVIPEQGVTAPDTDALSPAQIEELRSLLREVYPDPPASLRENVMAQIRLEKEGKAAEAVRREERQAASRRRRALFMKWGGMAACVTILCGVLAIASPLLNRAGGTVADEEAMAMDTVAETMAVLYADTAAGTSAAEDADENGAPEIMRSMLMTTALPGEEMKTEAEADGGEISEAAETVSQTTAAPEEEKATRVEGANGANDYVAEDVLDTVLTTEEDMPAATAEAREAFAAWLIANGYLDETVYREWLAGNGYSDGEGWQAVELCDDFNLDRSLIGDWEDAE